MLGVVFDFIGAFEDDNNPGSDFDKRFVGVGAQRGQIFAPLVAHPLGVGLPLFFFGGPSDLCFQGGVGHRAEGPGLFVGARRGGRGGADQVVDHLLGNRLVRKRADRATLVQPLIVRLASAEHYFVGKTFLVIGNMLETSDQYLIF